MRLPNIFGFTGPKYQEITTTSLLATQCEARAVMIIYTRITFAKWDEIGLVTHSLKGPYKAYAETRGGCRHLSHLPVYREKNPCLPEGCSHFAASNQVAAVLVDTSRNQKQILSRTTLPSIH